MCTEPGRVAGEPYDRRRAGPHEAGHVTQPEHTEGRTPFAIPQEEQVGRAAEEVRPREGLRRARPMRTLFQASLFTSSNVAVSLLGVVTSAILARHLSTSTFGSYTFSISFLQFVAMVFEFGVFASAARLVTLASERDGRETVGAAILLYVPVGALYCLSVFGLSFGVNGWFHAEAGSALRVAAPIAIAMPATLLVQQLAQGTDRLHVASITTLILQLLLICLLVLLVRFDESFTLVAAVVVRCIAVLVSVIVALVWLRPLFSRAKYRITQIIQHTARYGFEVYLGRLLSIGTYNMDVLMIAALVNSRSVGFYSLAGSIAAAAGLPVIGMSTALFATMAKQSQIRSRWLVLASAMGVFSAALAWIFAKSFIGLVFSHRYAPAAHLVAPLALAQAVRGLTSVYNTFLFAHGRGRQLRNAGFALAASNLIFNFALIPPFGAIGAAWASFFALMINLGAHVLFYRRSLGDGL
jgi:O-antigen/teichoic acid export membrane protein